VIIDDLDLLRITFAPDEADAELVVDSDAVLSLAVSDQLFQPISGEGAEIAKQR
jgi:hypothetical protein